MFHVNTLMNTKMRKKKRDLSLAMYMKTVKETGSEKVSLQDVVNGILIVFAYSVGLHYIMIQ